jgi:hypothetical protein
MSDKFSTAIALGAKAPFVLIMQLPVSERRAFIKHVSPSMAETFKATVLQA